jgi:glycosyltransferase involved in cell wall biosynthesis
MSVPFFTIVTPVYNGEKYISKTIESIINQTYQNFDYIIVDGLSKDNTLQKIISYKKYITKIISEKDNGMYDAISKGFSFSRGKYLLWLNSDDILIDRNALYRLHKILNKYSYDWVVGRVSFIKITIMLSKIYY